MGMPHGIGIAEDQVRFADVRAWSSHGMELIVDFGGVRSRTTGADGRDSCMHEHEREGSVVACAGDGIGNCGRMDRRTNSEFRGGVGTRSCTAIKFSNPSLRPFAQTRASWAPQLVGDRHNNCLHASLHHKSWARAFLSIFLPPSGILAHLPGQSASQPVQAVLWHRLLARTVSG